MVPPRGQMTTEPPEPHRGVPDPTLQRRVGHRRAGSAGVDVGSQLSVRTDPHRAAMRRWGPEMRQFSNRSYPGTAGVVPTVQAAAALSV